MPEDNYQVSEDLPVDRSSTSPPSARRACSWRGAVTPLFFELEGLSCGFDFAAPAAGVCQPPFPFTGTIGQLAVELAGELIADHEAALRKLMAQQ
jgi:hypothetical protein